MKKVNLREIYPYFYDDDCFVDVDDDVLEAFKEGKRKEAAQYLKRYRHKAMYSLERGEGIEQDMIRDGELSPEEMMVQDYENKRLLRAVQKLPRKQAKRIFQRFYLDMTVKEIAEEEGVTLWCIYDSIKRGLETLNKRINNWSKK